MNCILLNNEFNLKELQWLLNTMQTPPPPQIVSSNKMFYSWEFYDGYYI